MDIQNLQHDWREQGKHDSLVIKLFKESRQTKINYSLNKMAVFSITFMIYNLFVNIYSWLILATYFSNLSVRYTGIIMVILTYIAFHKNVLQLNSISKINNSKPIVESQKIIGKLKIQRIKHNRFIFIFANLHFWALIILVFQWDLSLIIPAIWENAAIVVVFHLGLLVLWLPIALWFIRKYDSAGNLSTFSSKMERESYLTDQSANSSLNKALQFVKEIESFENE